MDYTQWWSEFTLRARWNTPYFYHRKKIESVNKRNWKKMKYLRLKVYKIKSLYDRMRQKLVTFKLLIVYYNLKTK